MSENESKTPDASGHVHGPDCNHGHHEPQIPVKRATPKVGRNEPCPCNSGKKFKRCCGR